MNFDTTTCEKDFYFSMIYGRTRSSVFLQLQDSTSFSLEVGYKNEDQNSCPFGSICIYINSFDYGDRRSLTIGYDDISTCNNSIPTLNFNSCATTSCDNTEVIATPKSTISPCEITGNIFDINAKYLLVGPAV